MPFSQFAESPPLMALLQPPEISHRIERSEMLWMIAVFIACREIEFQSAQGSNADRHANPLVLRLAGRGRTWAPISHDMPS